MSSIITALEHFFQSIPLQLLEIWGSFGFLIGLFFMICAFGGITFSPGGSFGIGRHKQIWDSKAFYAIIYTFLFVTLTGYIGSTIVLVQGAQTFESLKDLSVFICILIFGYPALLIVPFAYGLSDIVEGVPLEFIWDWIIGYFINPACFWIAHMLIGRNPDFRKLHVWVKYFLFVFIFMLIEPILWGYICADKFTAEISYRNITPALYFTTITTWLMAPFAMLLILPLSKKLRLFWADIPGHVKEKFLTSKEWFWESGKGSYGKWRQSERSLPVRIFLVTPFVVLMLTMIGATAFFTLRSSEEAAKKLAGKLQLAITKNIQLQLDKSGQDLVALKTFLNAIPIATDGRAIIIDQNANIMASTSDSSDVVVKKAISNFVQTFTPNSFIKSQHFSFDVVTSKPLSRESWFSYATPYEKKGWIIIVSIPASYYLEGVRTGKSQSAMIVAIALFLALIIAAILATVVTKPIIRIAKATELLASGDLDQQLPKSRLEELGILTDSFNNMARQLKTSFNEIEINEERLQLAIKAANLGIWDWDIEKNILIWDDNMYKFYGVERSEFGGAYEAWSKSLIPEDKEQTVAQVEAALRGEHEFISEFRVRWPDQSIHYLRSISKTFRGEDGKPIRMVGINADITDQKASDEELQLYRKQLEELVAARTAQLEITNKELEAFSYSVSHDLRAPLRGIDGWSLALLEDYGETLEAKAKNYLERVRSEAQRMGSLIDDLLKLSQVTRTEVRWEPVDLTKLAQVVSARLKEQHCDRNVNFIIHPDLKTSGNAHLLEILLTNLIGNSCKFTSKIANAEIEVGQVEIKGRPVYFVKDNGAGFNKERAHNLFAAFQRFHRQSEFEGTGIGLAMVHRIINLHRGRIWAESEVNQGATFYFTIDDLRNF